MNEVEQVTEGAFFIRSYQDQTIIPSYNPTCAYQSPCVFVRRTDQSTDTEEKRDFPPEE
jgi:hypothetical protein